MDLSELHLHWRPGRYKGKTYKSYSLAKAYRRDGKNRKEIFLKLGTLTDEEATKWRGLLKALKQPDAFFTTLDDIVVKDQFAYLDTAVVSAIWDEWGLDRVFADDGKRTLSIATVARILTVNRCLDPMAKSLTPEWLVGTALPWFLDIEPSTFNSSRVFRELTVIEDHKEAICRSLFETLAHNNPQSMDSVFYDLSSTTFHGSRCVLMKWGYCKEGFRNHVVLALVVNQEGFPFYWEVLPGGTADADTISWLLERLSQRFAVNQSTVVFDRGMVSDANLELIEHAGVKYISAMDRNQMEGLTGLDFNQFTELNPERIDKSELERFGFVALGDGTYYREVKVEAERRYILCLNPQLLGDQRTARKQTVIDVQTGIDKLNAELMQAKKSRQRKQTAQKFKRLLHAKKVGSFAEVKLRVKQIKRISAEGTEQRVRTYQGKLVIDEDRQRQAGRLDGFWLLVTNHREKNGEEFILSSKEAIRPYRDKVIIESAFRDIKSFIDIAPVHVWTQAHVKAHYTICVLAYLIDRSLTKKLHEHPGKLTKDVITHSKLYQKLAKCTITRLKVKNVGLATVQLTELTATVEELLKRVGMERLLEIDRIKKAAIAELAGVTSKKKI